LKAIVRTTELAAFSALIAHATKKLHAVMAKTAAPRKMNRWSFIFGSVAGRAFEREKLPLAMSDAVDVDWRLVA